MPHKDPEVRKQYLKEWNERNKQHKLAYMKEYYKNNKQDRIEYAKNYQQNNPKIHRIACWKNIGVISENYDNLNDLYENATNCEECNVILTTGDNCSTRKCLDHDHKTGQFRNILCSSCNIKRG